MYHNNGNFFICGDFNSRSGDRADYVEGVDQVPSRHVIDHKTNGYMVIFFVTYCIHKLFNDKRP